VDDVIRDLLARPAFSLSADDRRDLVVPELARLCRWHRDRSAGYRRLAGGLGWDLDRIERIEDVPWLPVALFKSHLLASVADEEAWMELRSSGTSGGAVSRIVLDRETADLQARALAHIMGAVLGGGRRPMLVLDTPSVVSDPSTLSARGAGVLGLMRFGRDHQFAFGDDMEVDRDGVAGFLDRHRGEPLLVFGFTYMVWHHFVTRLEPGEVDLSQAVLLHSGGWKKLADRAVGPEELRAGLREVTGLERVYAFYGMAEQVGSVFLEGDDGALYAPGFADVVVRDPATWQPTPIGTPGVLQVLSVLPRSYPGHSLLTEDLGIVVGVDDDPAGRWLGTRFRVLGRVPRAELRGCGDTFAAAAEEPA